MEGYAKVAQLMGTHSDVAILRRFQSLNVQNLLYLQAEIIHLESELREVARRDTRKANRKSHAHDWWSLSQGECEADTEQWEAVLAIREKLEKYNDALLKQAAISRLESPTRHDLEFLRSWFQRPTMGSFPLLGLDRAAWDAENEGDLVALNARQAPDLFTRWFADKVIPKYHDIVGEKIKRPVSEEFGTGIFKYEESTLATIARLATTVVASVLPLCSVVILYIVRDNVLRLGVILILSACFSLALTLMTNARKIEVFAATSAFAAVNVVYLSNGTVCAVTT
ncbi:hypothetical protein K469DRAFT_649806 [Zopfia rhizophila CBS 207.26]|uniref:DUF6594 domain-containing protein n=1 Tax=Zopfia rhizophila CBS 207.26 TaxID=1314779 RepID=A0A6A6EY18_9PEZI|nr:hypothetical protein K469DRAFT_649806 [Zopfia rhizophila CBS 207.26]